MPDRKMLFALVLCGAACGHTGAPPPSTSAPAPAQSSDRAPGAEPAERDHLLEASWKEVRVKARKQGAEVVSAVKLVAPQVRIFHAAAPPEGTDHPGNDAKKPPDTNRPPAEVIDLARTFRKITPLAVDHLDILDGQVAFVDVSRAERP